MSDKDITNLSPLQLNEEHNRLAKKLCMQLQPFCVGCNKRPYEIGEFKEECESAEAADEYVRYHEGTYNQENGHFLCTDCYIAAGMPSRKFPDRWVAP